MVVYPSFFYIHFFPRLFIDSLSDMFVLFIRNEMYIKKLQYT
uniref:Uncharacterized protein n=1 Tax=viral metagenome TaxID=1070528 RepID=A0A6C0HVP7_9ZZZZ